MSQAATEDLVSDEPHHAAQQRVAAARVIAGRFWGIRGKASDLGQEAVNAEPPGG
jgi:hypothetical protein